MSCDAAKSNSDCSRFEQMIEQFGPGVLRHQALAELVACRPENAERIIEIITTHSALSARVLSVINSAALGMPRRIYSVARAVHLLGSARSRFLAMAHGLHLLTDTVDLSPIQIRRLWYNSIFRACCARTLCSEIDPPRLHDAFTLALIQDIALPILVAADPQFYDQQMQAVDSGESWRRAEREHFGIDHARAGAQLLELWGAAEHLVEQVAAHHDNPLEAEQPDAPSPVRLSGFLASLLPHDTEPLHPQSLTWIGAIHARFLAERNDTPLHFLEDVAEQTRLIEGREAGGAAIDCEQLKQDLTHGLCNDAPGLVTNLYKLESSLLCQQRDDAKLQSATLTDPLTGLLNRRGFETLAEPRLEWSRTTAKGMCVIVGDLDDFKSINDTCGHDAGDEALAALATLLRSSVRGDDLIARIGGDEFTLLIDQIDVINARRLAENLSEKINGRLILLRNDHRTRLHISLGAVYVEQFCEHASIGDLLARADAALRHRKRNGKQGLHFIEDKSLSARG